MSRSKVNPLDRWAGYATLREATFALNPELAERQRQSVERRDALAVQRKADDVALQSAEPLVRLEAQARRGQLVRDEYAHEAERAGLKKALDAANAATIALMKADTDAAQQTAAEELLVLLAPIVEANDRLAAIDKLRERFIGSVWGCDALAFSTLARDVASLRERLAARRARRIA